MQVSLSERIEHLKASWEGPRIQSVAPLDGGMSAVMLLVDTEDGCFVVRFPSEELRAHFDDPAGHEWSILEGVQASGLPGPEPLRLADGPDGRFLILRHMPGQATAATEDPVAYTNQMAEALAQVHHADLSLFPTLTGMKPKWSPPPQPWSQNLREPEVIYALLAWGDPPLQNSVLRHGDFWPGNLLWEDGQLTGIIDWENALLGPASADVGLSRLDVAWVFGFDVMESYTEACLALNPAAGEDLLYWDLRACLRPMHNLAEWAGPYASLDRPDITFDSMRTVLLEFVDRALRRL